MGLIGRACIGATDQLLFWFIVLLLTISEPVLIVHTPRHEHVLTAQHCVLAVSTFLYFIQLTAFIQVQWDKIEEMKIQGYSLVHRICSAVMKDQEELFIDAVFFCIGWAFIAHRPGLAALRSFRVFRLLWFYKVPVVTDFMHKYFGACFGAHIVATMISIMKFAVLSLDALSSELFCITERSRGGVLIIIILSYCAYIFGVVFWLEIRDDNDYIGCDELGLCVFTMIRLTVLDGNGLDFAFQLAYRHPFLFTLTLLYACVTAFGLINGLVGIFGTVFMRATEQSFINDLFIADDNNATTADNDNSNSNGNNVGGEDNKKLDAGAQGGRFVQIGGHLHGGNFIQPSPAKVHPAEHSNDDLLQQHQQQLGSNTRSDSKISMQQQQREGTSGTTPTLVAATTSATTSIYPLTQVRSRRRFGESFNDNSHTSSAGVLNSGNSFFGRSRNNLTAFGDGINSNSNSSVAFQMAQRMQRTEERLLLVEQQMHQLLHGQDELKALLLRAISKNQLNERDD